jgi:type IV secretion system protein VirB10
MATRDDELLYAEPTGPVKKSWVKVGLAAGAVLFLLVFLVFMTSATRGQAERSVERQTRKETVVTEPPPLPRPRFGVVDTPERQAMVEPRSVYRPASVGSETTQKPVDKLEEERQKRDVESLYASNVVFRAGGTPKPAGAGRGSDRRVDMPTAEDVAERVLRSFGGQSALQAQVPSDAPPVVAPTSSERQAAQAGRGRNERETPDVTPPIDDSGPLHRVMEGSIIDAVVGYRLDGSNASPVNAKVTVPFLSHDLKHVLIPADTKIIGETKPVQMQGETRLVVLFHRLIFPDGSSRSLDQFKGLSQVGTMGLKDQVNRHYLSTFGAAAAIAVVTGAGQAIGNRGFSRGSNGTTVIAGNMGNGVGQATSQVLNRFLNRLPTITIREGARFKLYVSSDIELPAYPSTL